MQTVTAEWETIFADKAHLTEIKAVIGGAEYTAADIYGARRESGLFADGKPLAGCAVSSEFEITVVPKGTIPRMAEIDLYVRLVSSDGESSSGWMPKGVYFTDTREKTYNGQALTLRCYDSMLKAEQTYSELTAFEEWPQPETDVAAEIAGLMGVEVDSRTALKGYMVPYPQDWTMREVLGYIAAANAGNWIITDENRLRLVKLAGDGASIMAEDHETGILMGDTLIVLSSGADYADAMAARSDGDVRNVGQNVQSFRDLGKSEPYTGVTVWWSDEDAFSAGDDSGKVLELDCPWATQVMADAILEDIAGFAWQGAEASMAAVTPAAELGDAVVCDGVMFTLAEYSVGFDGSYLPDISAPAEMEVDSEYHYESKTTRELARRAKLGESYYGVKLSREKGIEVELKDPEDAVIARAVFNATELSFYNDRGEKVLYFDPTNGRYKFEGDVNVSGVLSSPTIKGTDITVDGYFGVYDGSGEIQHGYMGAATGTAVVDGKTVETPGVALIYGASHGNPSNYIIVTGHGARIQVGGTSMFVIEGDDPGAYVDGYKIVTEQNAMTADGVRAILREEGLIA